jgi:NAD(P)-dependent dehydrogenase (short-subunit alcohol dehydrogenase family)
LIEYASQVALVTGAASGIGRALTEALVERGATALLADVDTEGANAVAEKLGTGCQVVACDLTKPGDAAMIVGEAFERFGRLDFVCSNAGIARSRPLLDEQLEHADIDRLFSVNLFAGLRLVQAYAERLSREGTTGRVMLTGSENSLSLPTRVLGAKLGLYGITKHGLLIMAEWLREEFSDGPIDLHVLLPGGVYTAMIESVEPDPSRLPPELKVISSERCAELALRGVDLGLFYIPTHAHILDDMQSRTSGITHALTALGLSG